MWNRDFKEFFASLNANKVRYLVIGGAAYNVYAPPRATKDIDIWVEPARDNLERLIDAIAAFGFPTGDLDAEALLASTSVIMLGRAPNRIAVLTRPAGLRWDEAYRDRFEGTYDDVPIAFLSLEHLIEAKRAAARARDLADVETLEAIRRRRRA